MNWKPDSLAYTEFISPLINVVDSLELCLARHYTKVAPTDIESSSHIILSGTPLKDFAFLQNLSRFAWMKTYAKPLLGINAGMYTILQTYHETLLPCTQIGMIKITTKQPNPLFSGTFEAYSLHSYTTQLCPHTFEVLAESEKCIQAIKHRQKPIYGLLFHPEARNRAIIERFARL